MPGREQRKLAAILFADIAGFTHQLHLDETKGLLQRRKVEQIVKSCVLSHNGRVVKSIGDAFMAEFGSAVQAVSCSIQIQKELVAPADSPDPVFLRIGVHTGDVVEEDGDLYGNAVNVAQRVQTMAPPGGICITREVLGQIKPILKLRCHPVKTEASKPLPEPVEVFRVEPASEETTAALLLPALGDRIPQASLPWPRLAMLLLLCLLVAWWSLAQQKALTKARETAAALERTALRVKPVPDVWEHSRFWPPLDVSSLAASTEEMESMALLVQEKEVPLDLAVLRLGRIIQWPVLVSPQLSYGSLRQEGTNLLFLPPVGTNSVSLGAFNGLGPRQALAALLSVNDLVMFQSPKTRVWTVTHRQGKSPAQWVEMHRDWLREQRAHRHRAGPTAEELKIWEGLPDQPIPLEKAVETLSLSSGINVLIDPKVHVGLELQNQGIATFRPSPLTNLISFAPLKKVGPRSALEAILEVNGLTLKEDPQSKVLVVRFD